MNDNYHLLIFQHQIFLESILINFLPQHFHKECCGKIFSYFLKTFLIHKYSFKGQKEFNT